MSRRSHNQSTYYSVTLFRYQNFLDCIVMSLNTEILFEVVHVSVAAEAVIILSKVKSCFL